MSTNDTLNNTLNDRTNDNTNDRFDRQNRVYGLEGTLKLQSASVAIIGPISDLTYEIAKNLALSGINNITLNLYNFVSNSETVTAFESNSETVTESDYIFCPGKIHNSNINSFVNEIKKLNPYVNISLDDIKLIRNSVVIFINTSTSTSTTSTTTNLINELDQSNKVICFFSNYSCSDSTNTNLVKYRFITDFKEHLITDIDGENYELLTISQIELLSLGQVDTLKNSEQKPSNNIFTIKTTNNHNLDWNSCVNFKLKSLDGTNFEFTKKIKSIINSNTFTIELTKFDKLIENIESVESVKDNIIFTYLINFTNGYMCREKEHLVLSHKSINDVLNENNWSESFNNPFDIRKLNPIMQYYIGSILASEAIKAITSKYLPVNQSMELAYGQEISFLPSTDLLDKLANLKCFMVGSGAIGCELLKNLVAIGASTNPESYIKVTDPDHIEVSNLSRQFLFRSENVGKSKSATAMNRIKAFNPLTNIIAFEDKLSLENQSFVDKHFSEVDIVFNALDNLSARLYVDTQCVKFSKPLFESGTLGTKGNTQPVIPHITESYGNSQDQEQESSFPACTIKNFPTLIQHTIHWAMDDFDGLFVKQPQMVKQYLGAINNNDYSYLQSIPSNEQQVIKNNIKRIINKVMSLNTVLDYMNWAYEIYNERFYNRISRLLKSNPIDFMIDDKLFWSNGKKCPKIMNFDKSNETAYNFLISTTKLLAETYNVNKLVEELNNLSKSELDELINKVINNDNKTIYCDDPDCYTDIEKFIHEEEEEKGEEATFKKELLEINNKIIINPQVFEKDNDLNNHILFVQSDSNSRAQNYDIPHSNFYETKGIAGKIIPALATTTSIVASLITMEMLKYVSNPKRSITDYASTFINLATNFIIQTEPIPPSIKEINGLKLTEWGIIPTESNDSTNIIKFESNKLMLLSEFINYWSKQFNNQITLICLGSKIIFMSGSKEDNLNKTLDEICNQKTSIELFIGVDDETIELPNIKVI